MFRVAFLFVLAGCLTPVAAPDNGQAPDHDERASVDAGSGIPVLLVEGTHAFGMPSGVVCDVALDWWVDLGGHKIHSPAATHNTTAALVVRIAASDWDGGCYSGQRLHLSDGGDLRAHVGGTGLVFQVTKVDGGVRIDGSHIDNVTLDVGESTGLKHEDWRVRYVGNMLADQNATEAMGVKGHWYPAIMPAWDFAMLRLTSDIREEGPDYTQDSYCGMSLPVAQIDVAAKSAWIAAGSIDLDPWRDGAVIMDQPRIQHMHDNGCSPSVALHHQDMRFTVFNQAVRWNITREGGLTVDGRALAVGESVTRDVAAWFDYPEGGAQIGRYWYNGTVTLTHLGDWSWQDVHPVAGYHEFPWWRGLPR